MAMHRLTGCLVALLLPLAACGAEAVASGAAQVKDPYAIPTSTVDVPLDGVSWMQGTVLHVDGRTVDTGVPADSYALIPHGVLLSSHDSLWFSDTRSTAKEVASGVVATNGVEVSPDGNHVGFVDSSRGPVDKTGERFFRLDVLDTRTGKQVLSSQKGMGDPHGYVAEQYEDRDPGVGFLSSTAAYAGGVGGDWKIPYDGSEPSLDQRQTPRTAGPGSTVNVTRTRTGWKPSELGSTARVAPDHTLGLVETGSLTFAAYDVGTGRSTSFAMPRGANRFTFGGWVGQHDFWGFAFTGSSAVSVGTGHIVTCAADTRRCTPVSATIDSTNSRPVLVGGRNDVR